MKIALIGYGKMGKTIERIATDRGHVIIEKFNSTNPLNEDSIINADVAIEFTQPNLAPKHIELCMTQKVPIVVGTTAWQKELEHIIPFVKSHDGTLLHASNFSLGVTIFQNIVASLSRLINPYPNYSISIEETHHTQKLDAPSGTAITLAETILENQTNYQSWKLVDSIKEANSISELPIIAHRLPDVPGTHTIKAVSEIDTITLQHEAHSRDGFALGAVIAAEWVHGKKGIFTMQDVLKLNP